MALTLTILRFDLGLFQETDILNHPDAFKLVPNTVILFAGSYLNCIIILKIMKQYSFLLSTINSLIISTGVLYRIHPADKSFKLDFHTIYTVVLIVIIWNIFGIATMNSINREDALQYTQLVQILNNKE